MTILASDVVGRIIDESSFYWRKHSGSFRCVAAGAIFGEDGDLTGSAHRKGHFICDANHWWHWFCAAGVNILTLLAPCITNEVSYKRQIIDNIHFTWHAQYLMRDSLHALEMSLHTSRRWSITFIFRGRCSIWCSWRVTLAFKWCF